MADKIGSVFAVPTFCLITGASRGIGRGIALELAERMGKNSMLVLTARSEEGLLETKRLVTLKRGVGIDVILVACDLSDMPALSSNVSNLLGDVNVQQFQHAVLFINAGSLGDCTKNVGDLNDPVELQNFFGFNVTSVICLTSKFLDVFKKREDLRRSVFNISTRCAVQAFAYSSLYCTSKAAKDMLFQVLALEEPDIRVMNYAPGVVDTTMQTEMREKTPHQELKKFFNDLKSSGEMLTVAMTCKMLMQIIEEDSFKNGDHVDYYDVTNADTYKAVAE